MAQNPVMARAIQDLRSVRITTTDGGCRVDLANGFGCIGHFLAAPVGGDSGHLLLFCSYARLTTLLWENLLYCCSHCAIWTLRLNISTERSNRGRMGEALGHLQVSVAYASTMPDALLLIDHVGGSAAFLTPVVCDISPPMPANELSKSWSPSSRRR